jgi:plastocyanin
MSRVTILLAAALAALVLTAAATPMAVPKLQGTVGPGFTITLKKGGKKVKTLPAGKYTFVVSDKATIHNFHLKGPGVNKVITGVSFTGTAKPVTLKLKKGKYTYLCDPHRTSLFGTFKVV